MSRNHVPESCSRNLVLIPLRSAMANPALANLDWTSGSKLGTASDDNCLSNERPIG
jgi:hypothetical protein